MAETSPYEEFTDKVIEFLQHVHDDFNEPQLVRVSTLMQKKHLVYIGLNQTI